LLCFERAREFLPRADAELLVGVPEVGLDRLRGHKQRLRDLSVPETLCRHLGHAPFARREGLNSCEQDLARLGPGRSELLPSQLNQARKDIWYEGDDPDFGGRSLEDVFTDVEKLVEAGEGVP
jgi:hypothetical protein